MRALRSSAARRALRGLGARLTAPRRAGSSRRSLAALLDAGGRGAWRLRKAARRPGRSVTRHGVFVVGCQRSGTSMLMDSFDRSRSTAVHSEHTRRAFDDYRLRDPVTVRRLIERGPAPVTVLKPICDSQWTDLILDQQPGSQAVWVYRHYADVARSAVAKWGGHQREVIEAVAAGRDGELGWRAERVPSGLRNRLRDLCSLTSEADDLAGAMLFWLLRNSFYFELGLERDPRVRLLSYDRLTERPEQWLAELFRATGCDYDGRTLRGIDARQRRAAAVEGVAPEIVTACDSLLGRLEGAHRAGPGGDYPDADERGTLGR